MVYSVTGNKAFITGKNGVYSNNIKAQDVRYGRNAANNYKSYIEDMGKGEAPVQFAYQYIPSGGKYSLQALMGNAYEELGQKTAVSVETLNHKFDKTAQEIKKINHQILSENPDAQIIDADFTAEALDLNNDGKVDIAEYATSTMAADMLDGDPNRCSISNLDGVITNKGEDASLPLYRKENAKNAKKLFTEIHQGFGLNKAMQEFKSNPNNLLIQ